MKNAHIDREKLFIESKCGIVPAECTTFPMTIL